MSELRDPVAAAERALAEGRAWEARDRLAGCLGHRPDDLQVQALLGDAWWRLERPLHAGRWWFLTDRHGPEVDEAVAAFRQSRSAVDAARVIRVGGGRSRTYAPGAADRLAALAADVRAEGGEWDHPLKARKQQPAQRVATALYRIWAGLIMAILLALTVGIWIVGIAAIGGWLA